MKWDAITFLEVGDVDSAHDAALQLGGGSPGVLNAGLIESATMAPRMGYYASLPGVLVYGGTLEEARRAAVALALRTVADRLRHGEPVPAALLEAFEA